MRTREEQQRHVQFWDRVDRAEYWLKVLGPIVIIAAILLKALGVL